MRGREVNRIHLKKPGFPDEIIISRPRRFRKKEKSPVFLFMRPLSRTQKETSGETSLLYIRNIA